MLHLRTKGISIRVSSIPDKRLAANRANAARSSGPKTTEGKARSAQNARKHGFRASSYVVVRLEDLDAVDRLRADLISVYQLVNAQELFAIERIALAQQAILCAARLESGMFTGALNEAMTPGGRPWGGMTEQMVDGNIDITIAQNRNYALAHGFRDFASQSNAWSLLLRYQAQAERNYRRAVEELDRLRALRPKLPNEPIVDAELEQIKPEDLIETDPARALFNPQLAKRRPVSVLGTDGKAPAPDCNAPGAPERCPSGD